MSGWKLLLTFTTRLPRHRLMLCGWSLKPLGKRSNRRQRWVPWRWEVAGLPACAGSWSIGYNCCSFSQLMKLMSSSLKLDCVRSSNSAKSCLLKRETVSKRSRLEETRGCARGVRLSLRILPDQTICRTMMPSTLEGSDSERISFAYILWTHTHIYIVS